MLTAQVRPGVSSSKMPNGRSQNPGLSFSNNKRLFNVSQAAKILGVSSKTLRRWDNRSIIKSRRTRGKQRRFTKSELLILFNKIEKKNSRPIKSIKQSTNNSPVLYPKHHPLTPITLIQDDFVRSCQLLTRGSWTIYSTMIFSAIMLLVLLAIIGFVALKLSSLLLRPLVALIYPLPFFGILIAFFFGSLLFLLITGDFAAKIASFFFSFLRTIVSDLRYAAKALLTIYKRLFSIRAERHAKKVIRPSERIMKPLLKVHMKNIQQKPLSSFHFILLLCTFIVIFVSIATSISQLEYSQNYKPTRNSYQYFEIHR